MLLDSEDDFSTAFAVKHSEAKAVSKPNKKHDQIESLLQQSRVFRLNDTTH